MRFSAASLSNLSKYISRDLDHAWIKVTLRYSLLGGALLAAAWMIYFALVTISIPYPIEYREGATQVMTQYLLEGKNPYALENQPMAMDSYGIVYSLFVLPLAALFGNTLLVHRVVTLVFLVLCFLLASLTTFAANNDMGLAIVCGVLVVMALGARGGLGAFPSAAGAFFFLMAIMIPFRRSFDNRGLALSAFLGLLAFYTKPYFMLSVPIVASYVIIFKSKKAGLLYCSMFALLFSVSFLIVRAALPLYFIYTIGNNLADAMRDRGWLYGQLLQLVTEFYPTVILALLVLLAGLLSLPLKLRTVGAILSGSNFLILDRPLVSKPINYFGFAFGCSTLVFVLLLGHNTGSYMSYAYQLMMPPFFLWLSSVLKPQGKLALIAIPLLLLALFVFARERFAPAFLEQKNSVAWVRLYQYTDSSEHILNTPIIASEMLRIGLRPVDSGRNSFWGLRPYPEISLIGPSYDVMLGIWQGYQDSVQASVMNREYDRIITVGKTDFFIHRRLGPYYTQMDTFRVTMPQTDQIWNVQIWEPSAESVE